MKFSGFRSPGAWPPGSLGDSHGRWLVMYVKEKTEIIDGSEPVCELIFGTTDVYVVLKDGVGMVIANEVIWEWKHQPEPLQFIGLVDPSKVGLAIRLFNRGLTVTEAVEVVNGEKTLRNFPEAIYTTEGDGIRARLVSMIKKKIPNPYEELFPL